MSELKNLKVSPQIHAALKARADRLGMNIYRLADALLSMALAQNDNIVQAAILQFAQENDPQNVPPRDLLTLPVMSTTPEHPKRTRKPPAA